MKTPPKSYPLFATQQSTSPLTIVPGNVNVKRKCPVFCSPCHMPQELTASREADILEDCQKVIGYQFRQVDLLRAALTHTSGADTRLASNERLEFLGDAVLGLVTCEQLYTRFPDYQEGDLTKIKSVVVSRRTCARISKLLNLGDYLFLGKGMHLHAVIPASLLADVFESLVAAIYLDGGLEAARTFILRSLSPEIDTV